MKKIIATIATLIASTVSAQEDSTYTGIMLDKNYQQNFLAGVNVTKSVTLNVPVNEGTLYQTYGFAAPSSKIAEYGVCLIDRNGSGYRTSRVLTSFGYVSYEMCPTGTKAYAIYVNRNYSETTLGFLDINGVRVAGMRN